MNAIFPLFYVLHEDGLLNVIVKLYLVGLVMLQLGFFT